VRLSCGSWRPTPYLARMALHLFYRGVVVGWIDDVPEPNTCPATLF
jgi:hypothetical protein